MDQALVTRIIEAALLAANQPLTLAQLRELFTLDSPAPEGSIEQALSELREHSAGRGVELVEVASGYRFQVQSDVHPWVARLWSERQTKYTRATLETLALVAYRQPITRGEIEQIRGVAVNSNIIKALEEREWIRVVGHRDMPGKPELLGTTRAFLDYFGLKRLDELPPLSELKDFGELEPELQFTDGPIVVDNIADLGRDPVDAGEDQPMDIESEPAAGAANDETAVPAKGEGVPAESEAQADEATASATDLPATETGRLKPALPEHDTLHEERADSDPSIAEATNNADADTNADAEDSPTEQPDPQAALAEEGDSTGARS